LLNRFLPAVRNDGMMRFEMTILWGRDDGTMRYEMREGAADRMNGAKMVRIRFLPAVRNDESMESK